MTIKAADIESVLHVLNVAQKRGAFEITELAHVGTLAQKLTDFYGILSETEAAVDDLARTIDTPDDETA